LYELIAKRAPDEVRGLDYTHRPLSEQFSRLGIRQIELGLLCRPAGRVVLRPARSEMGRRRRFGTRAESRSARPVAAAGVKVMHVQDIDYLSSVLTLVEGLKQVRDWSAKHPGHVRFSFCWN